MTLSATPYRLGLFGDIHHAATALADAFQNLVAADLLAHGFIRGVGNFQFHRSLGNGRGFGEQSFGLRVCCEQHFEALAEGGITVARAIEERGPGRAGELDGGLKQGGLALEIGLHGGIAGIHLPD